MASQIKTFTFNLPTNIEQKVVCATDEEANYLPNINESVLGEDDFKAKASE
jgi:hypothetical protein